MTDITSYIGTFCESKNNWTKRFAGIANKALFVYKTDVGSLKLIIIVM